MKKLLYKLPAALVLALSLSVITGSFVFGQSANKDRDYGENKYMIIRTDDAGMSHSVNMGIKKLLETNLPVSVSIMFPAPWYQEAVQILKQHPDVSVGIHLTLNSEWKNYRWGPVLGQKGVPSLVNEKGYFFPSAQALYDNDPKPEEVEEELEAQIKRAMATGLKIDYMDFHMGTARQNPMMRKICEKLAKKYQLGLSGYFGEKVVYPQYRADPQDQPDSLAAVVNRLQPGLTMLMTHTGINNPELAALVDMNTGQPLANMATHRQGELNALESQKFHSALKKSDVKLITYRQLIEMEGLDSMQYNSDENY